MNDKTFKSPPLFRSIQLGNSERSYVDEDKRTIRLSFSSEEPVEREFGLEVLDHSEGAVDLSRIASSGPLLVNHNRDDVVGVVEQVWCEGGRCYAEARFGRSERAQEVFNDVLDGIRRTVSFGYRVKDVQRQTRAEGDKVDTFLVTSWEPFEVSLEVLPADPTVGVGRKTEDEPNVVRVLDEDTDFELPDELLESVESVDDEEGAQRNEPTDTAQTVVVKENNMDKQELQKERQSAVQAERDRINGIEGMADKVRHLLPEADELAREFKNTDKSVADFNAAIVSKMDQVERKIIEDSTEMKSAGMERKDVENYSIVRALNAMATGNWNDAGYELELSRAVEDKVGQSARGLYVPYEVFSRADTTSAQAGDSIGTDHMASMFIDRLRDKSVVLQAGAVMMPGLVGDVDIPRLVSGADYAWIDNESYAGSDETQISIDKVTLSPETLRGRVALTRKLLKQSSPAIEQVVRNDMLIGIAQTFDQTALVGVSGTSQPSGIRWIPDVTEVRAGQAGAALDWATVVSAETVVNASNADFGSLAYISNSKVLGHAKSIVKDSSGAGGYLYENNQMNGFPLWVTNAVPSTFVSGAANANTGGALSPLFFGAWDQLYMGMWGGIDLELDKTTLGDRGALILRVFLDGDIAVRHPESFSFVGNVQA